jgi:two-component system cell cycle response regulator DivK
MAGELILIVEDDRMFARLLVDVLEHHGYRVRHVDSGEACLAAVEQEPPALVLMDIRMPGMGGIGAIERLRADPVRAAIKLIGMTASVMPDELEWLEKAGLDGLHRKPLVLTDLLGDIRTALAAGGNE